MYFYVSKLKFITLELSICLLIPLLCTLLLLILNIDIAITSVLWVFGFLIFLFQIDLHWRDQLYIDDNYIRLHRTKVSGAADLTQDNEVVESDYVIENLSHFTETLTKFILYGTTNIHSKNYTRHSKLKIIRL